jgi:hypothetical protein
MMPAHEFCFPRIEKHTPGIDPTIFRGENHELFIYLNEANNHFDGTVLHVRRPTELDTSQQFASTNVTKSGNKLVVSVFPLLILFLNLCRDISKKKHYYETQEFRIFITISGAEAFL